MDNDEINGMMMAAQAKRMSDDHTGSIPFPNQDKQFLQWLFDLKKQVSLPLRYEWAGYRQNELGAWVFVGYPVMNEAGISWCISYIDGYINPVFIISNFDETALCWTMRQVARVTYNTLCARYEEFGMHRLDIPRVGNEIVSKIYAILLGAQNNGYKLFFQTTHQTSEVRTTTQNPQGGGSFLGIGSMLNRFKPQVLQ